MNNLRTQSQYIKDTTREISDVLRRYVFTGEKRIKIFMKKNYTEKQENQL